ncbi:MAG TPA: hypothetical protein VF190_06060 [Rhodothermales bacterium]
MKRLSWILALAALLVSSAAAQNAGQIGIAIKSQWIPQAGFVWQATNGFSLRALIYVEGGGDEVINLDEAARISIAALSRFRTTDDVRPYVGLDFTVSTFEDENYVGPLFGFHYQPHQRFGLFGELGFSIDIGDSVEIMHMLNTGIGAVFYLNR